MKTIHIISGILLFLLIAVGSASATVTTYTLTEDNTNVNRDDPGTLPDGIIKVMVTYDNVTGKITYLDRSPTDSAGGTRPYITNPKIDEVAYNLPIDGSVFAYDGGSQLNAAWAPDNNNQVDGFGTFARDYTTDGSNLLRADKVVVTLSSTDGAIPLNDNSKAVALHLAFEGAFNKDGTAIPEAGKGTNLGSTYLAGGNAEIPEFSSIAVPVVAILGLLFISQRRREN